VPPKLGEDPGPGGSAAEPRFRLRWSVCSFALWVESRFRSWRYARLEQQEICTALG